MPQSSQGTTIKKTSGTAVANLTSIDGLDIKGNTIESTTLDTADGFKTFVSGLKEVNDVSISGYFDYTSHSDILTDLQAGTSNNYTIQFPKTATQTTNGDSWTFDAIVTGFKTKAGMDSLISFDATLKVSGSPTLVAGA